MKTPGKIAVLMLAGSAALSGCGLMNSGNDPEEIRAEAKAAFADHQAAAAAAADEISAESVSSQISGELSAEDAEAFNADYSSVTDRYDALSEEGRKALADVYAEANPVSDFYSFEGMTDAERAVLGSYALSTAANTDDEDAAVAKEINEYFITVEEDGSAKILYTDPVRDEYDTTREVFLVKMDEAWKIDGAKTYEFYVTSPMYSTQGGAAPESPAPTS